MSLRDQDLLKDQHLAKALKHAPDSDLAPSEAVRKNVLDYANKANDAKKPSQKPHKHWLAGWLPDMKNWQWAGMSSLAVALLAVLMLREQLPEELTRRDDAPKVLVQNQAKQMPEKAPEKEARVEADAASATMMQEEAPTRTAGLQETEKAKVKEKLESPMAPQIADKTVLAAAPEATAPPAPEAMSEPKAETAPAEQELAMQDTEKETPKDNSIVAETRARTEAAPAVSSPASDAIATSEQKDTLEKPAAAAKKSAKLGDAREGARVDVSASGIAKARQDIQAGVLRILVLEWPPDKPIDKPLVDEATTYRVELVTDLAPAELAAYNQTMRDWFNTQQ